MEREILFSGLRIDNGKWAEGLYLKCNLTKTVFICTYMDSHPDKEGCVYVEAVEVHPHTVGQYTGLKDKNGKRIFAGDIITRTEKPKYGGWWDGVITWHTEGSMDWVVKSLPKDERRGCYGMNYAFVVEVIGNIHQNPELLGDKQ